MGPPPGWDQTQCADLTPDDGLGPSCASSKKNCSCCALCEMVVAFFLIVVHSRSVAQAAFSSNSAEEFINWGEPQLSGEEDPSWLAVERSQRGDSVVLTSPQLPLLIPKLKEADFILVQMRICNLILY